MDKDIKFLYKRDGDNAVRRIAIIAQVGAMTAISKEQTPVTQNDALDFQKWIMTDQLMSHGWTEHMPPEIFFSELSND